MGEARMKRPFAADIAILVGIVLGAVALQWLWNQI